MAKRGPPSTFTKAIGRKLCDLVSEGTSLNAACQELDLPRRRVRNWLVRYPGFGAEMAIAQQMHWDQMAEEVVDIIDRCDGTSQAEVTKARAASDARKWVLSKVRPAQFGDRVQLAGDPDQPLIPETVDPDKIALGVMAILGAAARAGEIIEAVSAEPEIVAAPRRTVLTAEPAPVFAGPVDPLWQTRDPLPAAASWPGRVEPSPNSPTQTTDAAMAREEARFRARQRGWELFERGGR
jgi:hypothetical protein